MGNCLGGASSDDDEATFAAAPPADQPMDTPRSSRAQSVDTDEDYEASTSVTNQHHQVVWSHPVRSAGVNRSADAMSAPSVLTQGTSLIDPMQSARDAALQGMMTNLPIDIFVSGGKGEVECTICMVDFEEGDCIKFLPCMHSYHTDCIDDWLRRNFSCPQCLEPVSTAMLNSFSGQGILNLDSLDTSSAQTAAAPLHAATSSKVVDATATTEKK